LGLGHGFAQETEAPAPSILVGDVYQFEKQVSEFTLGNGLHFVVIERHQAPLISFHTVVRAGSVDLPASQSGLARLLERLAWSGTETIGSRDWPAEKKALEAVEEAYDRLEEERRKGRQADDVKLTSLQVEAQLVAAKAAAQVKPLEYLQVLSDNGGTAVRAAASADTFRYDCTLPSNKAELWFSMESQRLLRPVLRGFYAERERLAEEVRSAKPVNPEASLLDELAAMAFWAHPFRNPIGGWPGDVEHLRTAQAKAFLERYFVPGNITIALAGDVTLADAKRLAEKYFGVAAWTAKPIPGGVTSQEPPQAGPRTAIAIASATPMVAIAYRRPDQLDRDDLIFDVIHSILSGAPNGWLVQDLVNDKNEAFSGRAVASWPGGRYPTLFAFVVAPAPGRTLTQTEAAVLALVERLRAQPVDEATLARARTRIRALSIEGLSQNAGAASLLAYAASEYGNWRAIFAELNQLARISAADVQRVAAKYLAPERRTVAYLGLPGTTNLTAPAGTAK
jgi:predicted Zn-dependent peptidase